MEARVAVQRRAVQVPTARSSVAPASAVPPVAGCPQQAAAIDVHQMGNNHRRHHCSVVNSSEHDNLSRDDETICYQTMTLLTSYNSTMIQKQGNQPLFENILWSRPQRRLGRVLLIGGHRDGFAELQKVYTSLDAAGIAELHLALPNKLSRLVGNLPGVSLVPSTPSGSIARDALATLEHLASQVDAVSLGPDLSNNSETTLTAERLVDEINAAILIPESSVNQLIEQIPRWRHRQNMLIFLNQSQLLKLTAKLAVNTNIPLNITLDVLANISEAVSSDLKPSLVIAAHDHLIVADGGRVSLTPAAVDFGLMSTFWLQENKKYEALTTAAFVAANP